jgi:hypothetical protein
VPSMSHNTAVTRVVGATTSLAMIRTYLRRR